MFRFPYLTLYAISLPPIQLVMINVGQPESNSIIFNKDVFTNLTFWPRPGQAIQSILLHSKYVCNHSTIKNKSTTILQTKTWRIWFAICKLTVYYISDHKKEKKIEFVLLKYFLANKCQTAKPFTRDMWNSKVPVKQEKEKRWYDFFFG